jgi:hypothetical protein
MQTRLSLTGERVLVRSGPVDRRHRHIEQTQVDHQLATVVIPMIEQ